MRKIAAKGQAINAMHQDIGGLPLNCMTLRTVRAPAQRRAVVPRWELASAPGSG